MIKVSAVLLEGNVYELAVKDVNKVLDRRKVIAKSEEEALKYGQVFLSDFCERTKTDRESVGLSAKSAVPLGFVNGKPYFEILEDGTPVFEWRDGKPVVGFVEYAVFGFEGTSPIVGYEKGTPIYLVRSTEPPKEVVKDEKI
ncbi:MAG TPA: hypothetical protein ENN47_07600 [Mesotoga infera]|uniref:Uncharacterized protein n=1 Tax=Mesotoga infera TaxID=1236046 RepID=A0A7C1CZ21_9BACT|nr:hypothetical protein [Mesotoga infera]